VGQFAVEWWVSFLWNGGSVSRGTVVQFVWNMQMAAQAENPLAFYGYENKKNRTHHARSWQRILDLGLSRDEWLEFIVYREVLKQIAEKILPFPGEPSEDKDQKTLDIYLKMMELVTQKNTGMPSQKRLILFFFLLVNAMNELPNDMAEHLYGSLNSKYSAVRSRHQDDLVEPYIFDSLSPLIGGGHYTGGSKDFEMIFEALSASVAHYRKPKPHETVQFVVFESLMTLEKFLKGKSRALTKMDLLEFLSVLLEEKKRLDGIRLGLGDLLLNSLSKRGEQRVFSRVLGYVREGYEPSLALTSLTDMVWDAQMNLLHIREQDYGFLEKQLSVAGAGKVLAPSFPASKVVKPDGAGKLSAQSSLPNRVLEANEAVAILVEPSPRITRAVRLNILDPVFRGLIRWASNKKFKRVAHAMDVFRWWFNALAAPLLETYVFLTLASSLSPILFVLVAVLGFLFAHSVVEWVLDSLTFQQVLSRLWGRLPSAVVYLVLFSVLPGGAMAFWGVSILHGVKDYLTERAVKEKARRDAQAMMQIIRNKGDIRSVATENPNTLFPLDSAWSVRLLGVRPTRNVAPDVFINDMEGQLLSGHSVYSDAFRKEWDKQRVSNSGKSINLTLSPIVKSLTRVLNPKNQSVTTAIDLAFSEGHAGSKAVGIVVSNEKDLEALQDLINKFSGSGTEVSFFVVARTEKLENKVLGIRISKNIELSSMVAETILDGPVVNMNLMNTILTLWLSDQGKGTASLLLVLPEGTLPAVGFLDALPADSPLRQAVIYIIGGVPLQVTDFSQALKLGALLARQA